MPHKCEKISWFYLLLLSKLKRSFRIFLKFFFAFSEYLIFTVKVHVFWECHKNWQNLHCQFAWQYVVTVKSMVKILSIFVAFLENMNFMNSKRIRYLDKSSFLLETLTFNKANSCFTRLEKGRKEWHFWNQSIINFVLFAAPSFQSSLTIRQENMKTCF